MRRIYVSGPIGADDEGRASRVAPAFAAAARLLQAGLDPFLPHVWCMANTSPIARLSGVDVEALLHYEGWMGYDIRWLEVCDAVLRVPGASPGADREVALALEWGIPLFHDVDTLLASVDMIPQRGVDSHESLAAELTQLRLEIRDANAELDRIHASPGRTIAQRVRDSQLVPRAEVSKLVKAAQHTPYRRKLPVDRKAITQKFEINGHKVYMTVGLYDEDGMPGEVFFRIAKEGSTLKGLLESFGVALSWALQCGIPLATVCDKLEGMSFAPDGVVTGHEEIGMASSIVDFMAKWFRHRFNVTKQEASRA